MSPVLCLCCEHECLSVCAYCMRKSVCVCVSYSGHVLAFESRTDKEREKERKRL